MQPSGQEDDENADDRLVGRRLGKYRVLRKLGAGGMGVVFEAEDESLKRRVALKMVTARDPQAVKRFIAEAQAAARLNHPNVVTIHEVGQIGGQPFLTMELVSGLSAAETLRNSGAMSWKVATRVAIAACRGLGAAHRAGLIHRDLKPGNILLAKSGEIKLADFGLARWMGDTDRSMTALGTVMGTPEYMSPEQCSSDVLSAQSDLYSLGASYFALLTGRPPFVCDVPVQTMYAHCTLPVPDPRAIVSSIPEACLTVLQTAMAKQPHERYADALQMQRALESVLRGSDAGATVTGATVTGEAVTSEAATSTSASRPSKTHSAKTRTAKRRRDNSRTVPLAAKTSETGSASERQFHGVLIGMVATFLAIIAGVLISEWMTDSTDSGSTDEGLTGAAATLVAAGDPVARRSTDAGLTSGSEQAVRAAEGSETSGGSKKSTGLLGRASLEGHVISLIDVEQDDPCVVSVAISGDGRFLAARTLERDRGRLVVWNLKSEQPLLDQRGLRYGLNGRASGMTEFLGSRLLDFSAAGDWLATGQLATSQYDVEAWRVPMDPTDLPSTLRCDEQVHSLDFSPVDRRLLVAGRVPPGTSADSVFEYEDWPDGFSKRSDAVAVWSDRPLRSRVESLQYSANGRLRAVANGAAVRVYVDQRPVGEQISLGDSRVTCLAFCPVLDSEWLAIGGAGVVEVFNAVTAERVRQLTSERDGVPGSVGSVAFSPNGRWLLVAGGNHAWNGRGEVRLYSTVDWSQRGSLPTDGKLVSSVAISPVVPLAVAGSAEGAIRLWDLRSLVGPAWQGMNSDDNTR